MTSNLMIHFILIILLTLINAFFASAEMAIITVNKNKIMLLANNGNKKAKELIRLIEKPTKFLSTIQVGITLAGFFNSASAATGIADDLSRFISYLPYSKQIAIIFVTIILSYITLVFGELFPKRIALKKSEPIAMFSVRPILWISKIASPFIHLLSTSTNILVKLVGLDGEKQEERVTEEEIKSLIEVGQAQGVLNATEKQMINSVFAFDDKISHEIMTPRSKAFCINVEAPLTEYIDEIILRGYSRIPVYEIDKDHMIGILYIKDLLAEVKNKGFEKASIRGILHEPYIVSESIKIDKLFKELQTYKKHMALLVDVYGNFTGLVTIEDLVEEIMGEIEDE